MRDCQGCHCIVEIVSDSICFTRGISVTVRVRAVGSDRWRIVKIRFVNAVKVRFGCFGSAMVNAFHTFFDSLVQFRSEGVDSIVQLSELIVGVVFRTLFTSSELVFTESKLFAKRYDLVCQFVFAGCFYRFGVAIVRLDGYR